MKLKTFASVLCLASVAATSAVASDNMGPAALGRLNAVFTLCAKADAKDRVSFDRFRAEMIIFAEGTPQEMRAPGYGTSDFKSAYDAVFDAAGRDKDEDLAHLCRRMIRPDLDKDRN